MPSDSQLGPAALPPPAPAPRDGDYRLLFDALPTALLVLDRDAGRVLDANRAACALLGHERTDLLGETLPGLSDQARRVAADRGRVAADVADVAARRRDGTAVHVQATAAAAVLAGGRAVLTQLRDVTETQRAEDQRRQAAKLQAIGQLAGGVAHDFNNLLTVIQGYAELLAGDLGADERAAGPLAEIAGAAQRAADLTQQLLAFSRQQVLRPQPVCMAELVTRLMRMLTRLVGADVHVVTRFDPDLDPVYADPGQVEQVVLNLAVNARDAMPRGGTLTVECRRLAEGDGSRRFVRLTVADTGVGMTADVQARIFEPFFTTKGPGKGTGLGLATVFGIVQQSAGRIAVDSRVGVGTTFRIDLPVALDPAGEDAPPPAIPPTAPAGNAETILLVEDEEAVRVLALHTLQARGYTVLDAENGEQALRVVQAFNVPVDLLVTDVVMPRVGGRELADRLRALQPRARALYTSSYPDDEVARRVGPDRVPFLPKPYSMADLLRRVREILDGGPIEGAPGRPLH